MAGRKSKRNRRALQESRSASRISRSPVDSAIKIDTVCKTIDQESQGIIQRKKVSTYVYTR